MKSNYIISITGTKGKTTLSRLLNYFFLQSNERLLLVDSDGHYINGEQKSTHLDSVYNKQMATTVCPGKYLFELMHQKGIAILETSVGSSGPIGLGYTKHQTSVFTNVFEDHLGSRIKNKEELLEEKLKISLDKVSEGDTFIFNANDSYISKGVIERNNTDIQYIPIYISSRKVHYDIADFNFCMYEVDSKMIRATFNGKEFNYSLKEDNFSKEGEYLPAVYAILAALAVMYSYSRDVSFIEDLFSTLGSYVVDQKGGRMVELSSSKKDIDVILDFAHEKESLRELAAYARKKTTSQLIGVVRFSADRTKDQLEDYARSLAHDFDKLIIYDKNFPYQGTSIIQRSKDSRFIRDKKDVPEIIYQAADLVRNDGSVIKVKDETEAFTKAFQMSTDGDVIIHISNKHEESYEIVKGII